MLHLCMMNCFNDEALSRDFSSLSCFHLHMERESVRRIVLAENLIERKLHVKWIKSGLPMGAQIELIFNSIESSAHVMEKINQTFGSSSQPPGVPLNRIEFSSRFLSNDDARVSTDFRTIKLMLAVERESSTETKRLIKLRFVGSSWQVWKARWKCLLDDSSNKMKSFISSGRRCGWSTCGKEAFACNSLDTTYFLRPGEDLISIEFLDIYVLTIGFTFWRRACCLNTIRRNPIRLIRVYKFLFIKSLDD